MYNLLLIHGVLKSPVDLLEIKKTLLPGLRFIDLDASRFLGCLMQNLRSDRPAGARKFSRAEGTGEPDYVSACTRRAYTGVPVRKPAAAGGSQTYCTHWLFCAGRRKRENSLNLEHGTRHRH